MIVGGWVGGVVCDWIGWVIVGGWVGGAPTEMEVGDGEVEVAGRGQGRGGRGGKGLVV